MFSEEVQFVLNDVLNCQWCESATERFVWKALQSVEIVWKTSHCSLDVFDTLRRSVWVNFSLSLTPFIKLERSGRHQLTESISYRATTTKTIKLCINSKTKAKSSPALFTFVKNKTNNLSVFSVEGVKSSSVWSVKKHLKRKNPVRFDLHPLPTGYLILQSSKSFSVRRINPSGGWGSPSGVDAGGASTQCSPHLNPWTKGLPSVLLCRAKNLCPAIFENVFRGKG